jgi:hypothetical protein
MLNVERVRLQRESPSNNLGHNGFVQLQQISMVSKDREWSSEQLLTPLLDGPDHCKQFLLENTPASFGVSERL